MGKRIPGKARAPGSWCVAARAWLHVCVWGRSCESGKLARVQRVCVEGPVCQAQGHPSARLPREAFEDLFNALLIGCFLLHKPS